MVGPSRGTRAGGLPVATHGGPLCVRPRRPTSAPSPLANRSFPLRKRWQDSGAAAQAPRGGSARRVAASAAWRADAAARWRRDQRHALEGAEPRGGADAAAARWLRNWSIVDATASTYDGGWKRFKDYCSAHGRRSLPASTATVTAFLGHCWRQGTLVASSLKPVLAAIRKRHLAAGLVNPCDHEAVREAKSGYRRAGLALRPVTTTVRTPLPSHAAWKLARLASTSPPPLRRRLTALVMQFWWMRRAKDITRLTLEDVDPRPDGSVSYKILHHKTAARKGLITRTMPAGVDGVANLPYVLISRLVRERRAAGYAAASRLFTACEARAASGLLTKWLRDGLARVAVTPAVGTCYASHSLKSGGATSANAAGVTRGAIAELSVTTERTLAESYISALTVPSRFDWFFFARLLPA